MFYVLRFLLGALEAGFFPGVLFVLTLWVPWEYRGRLVGMFMGWSAIANMVGAVIGGLLLDADGLLNLRGWQWVFLMTALPAIIMGVVAFFILPSGPEQREIPDRRRQSPSAHDPGARERGSRRQIARGRTEGPDG